VSSDSHQNPAKALPTGALAPRSDAASPQWNANHERWLSSSGERPISKLPRGVDDLTVRTHRSEALPFTDSAHRRRGDMRKLTTLLAIVSVLAGSAAARHGNQGAPTGFFNVTCPYSHSLMDDPIVYPGQPCVSHMHDFYGN